MKAYKVEILVIDHDEIGGSNIMDVLENIRYPNDCISPTVMNVQEADIGEWTDEHPLNQYTTQKEEFVRLFPRKEEINVPHGKNMFPVYIGNIGKKD